MSEIYTTKSEAVKSAEVSVRIRTSDDSTTGRDRLNLGMHHAKSVAVEQIERLCTVAGNPACARFLTASFCMPDNMSADLNFSCKQQIGAEGETLPCVVARDTDVDPASILKSALGNIELE